VRAPVRAVWNLLAAVTLGSHGQDQATSALGPSHDCPGISAESLAGLSIERSAQTALGPLVVVCVRQVDFRDHIQALGNLCAHVS
jgi:hypothetical protein